MKRTVKGSGTGSAGASLQKLLPAVSAERTPYRILALAAAGTLLATFLSVLYRIVQISADPTWLLVLAAVTVGVATALAGVLAVRSAVALAGVFLVGGLGWYLGSLPYEPLFVEMAWSNLELLSGRSILRIEQSDVWALGVTPGPVFATWYLTLRRWYGAAALAGFSGVGYFVLTGDAGVAITLLAVLSAVALVGFGDLAERGGSVAAVEAIAVVLAVMVVTPLAVSVVPGGSATPLSLDTTGGVGGGGDAPDTIEASLVSTDSKVDVVGSIELSPAERFTVESPEPRYWRVASYDRYTGETWIRTGGVLPYPDRDLSGPEGKTRRIEQRVTAESDIQTMPAAWRPVALANASDEDPGVALDGSLVPDDGLETGDSYRVTSAVLNVTAAALAKSGTDDPADIERKYTQLPGTTPDRVAERTGEITAGADNRYETAKAVESWLLDNREYSLTVDRPDGNVADAFLFEMERGYCVYYATTMVVMLRSQDVPARLTVGYTPGEEVENGTYRVRGYNSHAWVEVYFPDQGWVAFDPTPAGPRQAAEQAIVNSTVSTAVDTETEIPIGANRETPEQTTPNTSNVRGWTVPSEPTATPTVTDTGSGLPALPSRERIALGAVVLLGAVAGLRRSGLPRRVYRSVWIRWQPRADPDTDAKRAFRRLSVVLEQRHRARRRGETVRQYLDAVDAGPAARRVATIRERAQYGPGVTEEEADEAVALVDQVRGGERRD